MDVSTHTPYTPLVFGGGVLPAVPSPGTCGNSEFEYVFVVIFMFFMIVDFLISVLTVVVVCFFAVSLPVRSSCGSNIIYGLSQLLLKCT